MKLKVLSDYRSHLGGYRAGQEIEVEDERGQLLQRDSPDSFEEIKEKAPTKPPADKMIKPGRSKTRTK